MKAVKLEIASPLVDLQTLHHLYKTTWANDARSKFLRLTLSDLVQTSCQVPVGGQEVLLLQGCNDLDYMPRSTAIQKCEFNQWCCQVLEERQSVLLHKPNFQARTHSSYKF